MANATAKQYQAIQRGGPFIVASIPMPIPGPKEVSIRLRAVALNLLDWRRLYLGILVDDWPIVLGSDGAGVVEAVGQGVDKFRPGDEVFSLFGHDRRAASFQEISVVPEMFAAKKPSNLTFEEAASLPISYCSAAAAIIHALKIPLPFLPDGATTGSQPKSVLVFGGSSSVGAAAIQILKLALPTAIILATSSPEHHAHLYSLGATRCLDPRSPSLAANIKLSTPNAIGVDMIIDAVAGGAYQADIYNTLNEDGPGEVGEVFMGAISPISNKVKRTVVDGLQVFDLAGGKNAMSALAQLLAEGKYKLPSRIQRVGTGFEAIAQGLELVKKGPVETKLVVTV